MHNLMVSCNKRYKTLDYHALLHCKKNFITEKGLVILCKDIKFMDISKYLWKINLENVFILTRYIGPFLECQMGYLIVIGQLWLKFDPGGQSHAIFFLYKNTLSSNHLTV